MTTTPVRDRGSGSGPGRGSAASGPSQSPGPVRSGSGPRRQGPGAFPWVISAAIAVAVLGTALSLNGVLRGWAWYLPVATTVIVVALALAALRWIGAKTLVVSAGAMAALILILTFTFFRQRSFFGLIPTSETMEELRRLIRRASDTVVSESAPVAPNAGIVLVTCASLGLIVILVDALAVPLSMPATSGLGLLAVLVVPATIKPQSVGLAGFLATGAGYAMILAACQWFAPDSHAQSGLPRGTGHLRRTAITGALALAIAVFLPLAIPGFDRGTFPQGSRLNPWGASNGLNPMITLGNSLRNPTNEGRIVYTSSSSRPVYLRSVTIDRFDGESWSPDDRNSTRRVGPARITPGYGITGEVTRDITSVDSGQFSSPYLPVPFAPESVTGLSGQWTWDPATLSIKSDSSTSRNQQYIVFSTAPKITAASLLQAVQAPVGVPDEFKQVPANVPDIVRRTATTVAAGTTNPYGRALAIQRYLRSPDFSYSLQAPVQGGYDGNGMSVLADFLEQKSGYCVHFASAMAVLARLEGIPSRIAVGFAPGRMTGDAVALAGQGSFQEYEVDARDAHAWPELYFEGLGWVPFEPTPSRGVVPDYATEQSDAGNLSTNLDPNVLLPTAPATGPAVSPLPAPAAAAGGEGANSSPLTFLYGALAVVAAVLVALSPRLVRSGVRARRLQQRSSPGEDRNARRGFLRRRRSQGPPANAPELAWAELQDLATDYGVPPSASETPRRFSARLRGSSALGEPEGIDDAGHTAVESLTWDFERHRFGRPLRQGAQPAADRIAAVRASLQGNARWLKRMRAEWLPPSVTSRWGHIAGWPFRVVGRSVAGATRATGRGLRRTGQLLLRLGRR